MRIIFLLWHPFPSLPSSVVNIFSGIQLCTDCFEFMVFFQCADGFSIPALVFILLFPL